MNTEVINREFEAYRKDDLEARAILDLAASENRTTTAEEDERFDALLESASKHKTRADKLRQMADDSAEFAEVIRSRVGDLTVTERPTSGVRALPGDVRLVDTIRAAQRTKDTGEDFGERFLELPIDLEARAIANFSDNGALYTTDFSTSVAIYQRTASPWINLASVINADNGRPLNLPNLTADPTTYTPGEGTAITEATPTVGSAALTTAGYKALAYVSAEAEEDELIGLLPIIARSQGRSIGLAFGSAITTEVLSAATNGGTAAGLGGGSTATFIGYEDLLILKYGRAVPYRQAGVWIMANGLILKVRRFRDTVGQYLWQPAVAAGQPPTFDGDPVYEDPNLATPASATKSVLFGDASALVIKQMALRVAVSTEFRFNLDQVAIKSVYRAGAKLPDAAALAYMVSANS